MLLAVLAASVALTLAPIQAHADGGPFTASFAGRIASTPGQDASRMFQQAVTFGRGSLMTDTTAFFSHVLDATADPGTITLGSFEFLGFTGDVLFGSYEGRATAPDAAGNSFFTGVYLLTGGVGTLAGIQGSGTLSGVSNVTEGTLRVALEGEVRLPAASGE